MVPISSYRGYPALLTLGYDLPGIATRRYYVLPDSRDRLLSTHILYKKDGFKASVLNKREESNDRRSRIQSCDGGDCPPR